MRNRLRLLAVPSTGLFALVLLVACLARLEAQTVARLSSNARGSASGRAATSSPSSASSAAPVKRLVPLRTNETAGGSRVVVASDAPLDDYAAYREGERFYVLIPRAEALFSPDNLAGRGFADAEHDVARLPAGRDVAGRLDDLVEEVTRHERPADGRALLPGLDRHLGDQLVDEERELGGVRAGVGP